MSNLYLIEKFMKFVSTIMWKGGPSCVLYWKNKAEDTCGTCNIKKCRCRLFMSRMESETASYHFCQAFGMYDMKVSSDGISLSLSLHHQGLGSRVRVVVQIIAQRKVSTSNKFRVSEESTARGWQFQTDNSKITAQGRIGVFARPEISRGSSPHIPK